MGGQGHTCVHYTGACVSPWSVVEVGQSRAGQSRPHKKSVETECSEGGDTEGMFLGSRMFSLCINSACT